MKQFKQNPRVTNVFHNKVVRATCFFIVLVILGGFVLFQGNRLKVENRSVPTPSPTQAPTAVTSETSQEYRVTWIEDTTTWHYYSNKLLGFAVQYPKDWTVKDENYTDVSTYSNNKQIFSLGIQGDLNEALKSRFTKYSSVGVSITKVNPDTAAIDFTERLAKGDKKIDVGGYKGIIHINDSANTNVITREVQVQKGDLLFAISLSVNFPGDNIGFARKRADAILKSFTFTDKVLLHKSPSLIKEFKTKQFDVNNTKYNLFTKYYPQEVLSMEDTNLVPMNCNGFFAYYYGYDSSTGFFGFGRVDNTDIKLSAYPKELHAVDLFLDKLVNDKYIEKKENEHRYISSCSTKDERIFIVSVESDNGMQGNDSYFAVVKNNNVEKIIPFPKPAIRKGGYGCRQPLELTTENDLYLACGSGYEGVDVASYIFKINLNDYSSSQIQKCEATDTHAGGEPKITCS